MAAVFWVQLRRLTWKNFVVVSQSPITNLLRCLVLPTLFAVFIAYSQFFLSGSESTYGLGAAAPVLPFEAQFDGKLSLVWIDNTTATGSPSPQAIIDHLSATLSPKQREAIKRLSSFEQLSSECGSNFRSFSKCFGGIVFNNIPKVGGAVDYALLADQSLYSINVLNQQSNEQQRVFPLQWAIDKAIIELQTGVSPPTPRELIFTPPYTSESRKMDRLWHIHTIWDILGIAYYLAFLGIVYHLPGAVANERALEITPHMKAMGLLDSARIISWHISTSIIYLPSWIIIAVVWKFLVFYETSMLVMLLIHILPGLVLASWCFFVAAPFGKSPQLASIVASVLCIVFAVIAIAFKSTGLGVRIFLTLIFPPTLYIYSIVTVSAYEYNERPANLIQADPMNGHSLLPLLIVGIVNIFLWPFLAILWERAKYDAKPLDRLWYAFWRTSTQPAVGMANDSIAISVRDASKTYSTSLFSSKGVTAVSGLSLDIPKTGIFVLLGSNGAGKSTLLSSIGGLSGLTSGSILFAGNTTRPSRGSLGLVPQKNVLFPGLSCLQTLQVWQAVKHSSNANSAEDLEQLLRDCDLDQKIHALAGTLSGGQKRKLQLAIGLVGGSKILLVDECTSGVDPLSRRSLWRTLTAHREDCCIVFTTHFLDEADLLGDHIAILAAPGKVLAQGSPVTLKRDFGNGYTIHVSFPTPSVDGQDSSKDLLLALIQQHAPKTRSTATSPSQTSYHLNETDAQTVQRILAQLDNQRQELGITSYDVTGTTIENVFLDLMRKEEPDQRQTLPGDQSDTASLLLQKKSNILTLATGRPVPFFHQALTIFYKRLLIARRSWLSLLIAMAIAIAGSCIPLNFIDQTSLDCTKQYGDVHTAPIYFGTSPDGGLLRSGYPTGFDIGGTIDFVQSPPNIVQTVFNFQFKDARITDLPSLEFWEPFIVKNFTNIIKGGLAYEASSGSLTYAWKATEYRMGPIMQNLASNVLYRRALNASGNPVAGSTATIEASLGSLPSVFSDDNTRALRWVFIFVGVMAAYPAFFALYVARERLSSVRAMQLSNGLSNPFGLWVGHGLFDCIVVFVVSTVAAIVMSQVARDKIAGPGFVWLILTFYGFSSLLLAYCVTTFATSPLAAFAISGGYQIVIGLLYVCSYMILFGFAERADSGRMTTILHFAAGLLAPIVSLARTGLIATNIFSLLCENANESGSVSLGGMRLYGGPILYLLFWCIFQLYFLVWLESDSILPRKAVRSSIDGLDKASKEDIELVSGGGGHSDHALRVLGVSKTYGGNKVVDDISLSVGKDTIFALLGPNGAGKTTTFNIIRGDVMPETGDVFINDASVIRNPKRARASLGVCPQFIAIDSQLTVREHLIIYGRLKGLRPGPELDDSVTVIINAIGLTTYSDRFANKLSGGNQRKLCLAIALMGNPPVLLVDEFSTGIDPKMKREMWGTLREVAKGKAVVITTHSMEEASTLADSVGIIAKRVLAIGTTASLSERYANYYEVHFSCRTREETVRARTLMNTIPGSRIADDVATRFEVPIQTNSNSSEHLTLSRLFEILSSSGAFTEYTVEKASLESVFLQVIRQNNVATLDDSAGNSTKGWSSFLRR